MRPIHFLVIGCLIAVGCDKSPTKVESASAEQKAWIGSYTGTPAAGDMVMDLTQVGSTLSGSLVFGSIPPNYVRVRGTMNADSMFLMLDPAVSPTPSDFSLRAEVLAGGTLSGTMTHQPTGLNASLSCRGLTRRQVDVDASHNTTIPVAAMEFDGSLLWLSTADIRYVRMTPDGTIVDSIQIYHSPGGFWTSTALMFDGSKLWGTYPVTISGPGVNLSVADVLGFNAGGRTADSLRLDHRPVGLAYDGTNSWSLRNDPTALIRFDGTGAVLDSIPLAIPDAVYLDFDGTHFWTLGWHLRRLYEVAMSGEVLAICDLPNSVPFSLATGLAAEGTHVWYSESSLSATTLHRLTPR